MPFSDGQIALDKLGSTDDSQKIKVSPRANFDEVIDTATFLKILNAKKEL